MWQKYYAAKLDLACSARREKPSLSLTAISVSYTHLTLPTKA